MSDKLYKSDLTPSEKLVLAYILRGHYRYKYISLETFSKDLYMSQPSISKVLKSLELEELIKWVKVDGNKYKIIIVCQKAFNKYAFLSNGETVNEKPIVKDNVINTLGEIEAKKDLITFKKDKNGKRQHIVPSWYNNYKQGIEEIPKEMDENEKKEMQELVDTIF